MVALPRLVIGLDLETSDWDDHCSFRIQDEHLHHGIPCQSDHQGDAGYICGFGYCVFERVSPEMDTYVAHEPISSIIKLPEGHKVSPQAFKVHGISTGDCQNGDDLSVVLQTISTLLKEGAEICCHNVAHESLVFCREIQKRRRLSLLTLPEEDVSLLLCALYKAHCTLIFGKQHIYGYYRKLSDEFRSCFPTESRPQRMHDAGEDAYKCGRLLLHYNGACFASTTVCEHETRSPKKVKSSITAVSRVQQSSNNCMRTGNAFVQ